MKVGKYLGLVLFCIVFCAQSALAAEPGPAAAVNRKSVSGSPNSFSRYRPTVAEYPAALRPVVERLIAGIAAGDAKDAAGAKRNFNAAIQQGRKLLGAANRGYADELKLLMGLALEGLGQKDQARAEYRASTQERADNPLVLFRSAVIDKEQGRFEEALRSLREVEWRTDANKHEVLFEIGDCLTRMGKEDEAIKYIEQAHQRNPTYIPALRRLVGNRAKALEHTTVPAERKLLETQLINDLTLITQQDPEDRESALILARLLLRHGDALVNAERLTQAESLARRLVEQSAFGDVEAVRILFDTQIRLHDLTSAKATLHSGLSKNPSSPVLKEAAQQLSIEEGLQG